MTSSFAVMEAHLEAPRQPSQEGKLVLSRLRPGRSMLGSFAPSLKLALEGEEVYEIDGREVRVRPGQFLYLDAGGPCLYTNKSATIGFCLSLPHNSEAAGAAAGHDPVLGRALVLSTSTSGMGRTLERNARLIASDPGIGSAVAEQLVATVAAALAEPLTTSREAMQALKVAKPSTRVSLFQRLDRARAFLHDHDDRNVALGELAVANLSQFHLARYFKLAFGEPPIAYHRRLRLDRAAKFLEREEGTLAQAAEMAGYSEAAALCHALSRRFGRLPGDGVPGDGALRSGRAAWRGSCSQGHLSQR